MAAEKPETTAFPVGNLFAILLLVAGVVANRLQLESARPASEDTTGRQIAGLQDVAVRLWQDPFMAHEKSNAQRREDAGHTLEHFAQNIKALVGDGTLTVLGVSVFGGSYAEDQESRRRTRYAVISALGATAYQPWDAEKIGLIRPTPRESETAGLPPLVPFEVYTDGSRENHHVLVMWLDESYYLAKPLERFAALRETVDEWNPDFQLRIVGPGSSDTIHTLVQQVCGRTAANENAISSFGRIQFFSSSATTRLERLGKLGSGGNTGDALSTDDRPMGGCPEVWFNLLRVTNTDDQLAAALVTELANRGIKPGQPYDPTQDIAHVAFVYEWDNLFSRIWRDEFIEQVRAKSCANANARPPPDPACGAAAALKPPDWITSARYMRGLDGAEARKPSQTKAGANGAAADHKASSKSAARTEDRADGAGQFDYLQRLAEALRAHDAKLREPDAKTEPTDKRAKKQKSSIRAIGIIGNDPYDKLLVLQALRPHFPDAIFFTNDLDARLLQKEQYKWTRNLLVASAFGLQLEPAQQNGTAPFRDSYQTGAFLATRLALTANEESDFSALHRCIQARIAPARLFEIGRTFAADISPIGAAALDPSNLSACGDIPLLSEAQIGETLGSLHPATKNLFEWPGKAILGWLTILMLIALLVAMFSRTAQSSIRGKLRYLKTTYRERRRFLLTTAAGVVGVLAPCVWLVERAVKQSGQGIGEPFTLFEGISMWPSELIRVTALLIGIVLLIRTWFDLLQNRQKLKTEFALPEPIPVRLRPTVAIRRWDNRLHWRRTGRWLCAWWHRRIGIAGWQPDPRTVRADVPPGQRHAVDVLRLWKAYGVRSRLPARCLRVLPLVAVFTVFSFVVMNMFGAPSTPYRGDAMLRLNFWLTLAFSITNSFLVFAVLDAIRLCKRFVQHLQAASSNWPQSTISLFQTQFHIEEPQQRSTEEQAGTLNDWIDVQFIARHTEAVTQLLWYPTIVMALLVFARADIFDSWTMPGSLLSIYLLLCVFLAYLAISLQRMADNARQAALARMSRKLIAAKGINTPVLATQIELLSNAIRDVRRGAFLPMSQRPLVRTVMMGLGSIGGVELINYLNIVAR